MKALTDKQAAILAFIERYIAEHELPPTTREIGAAFGIGSTNGVRDHLEAIARKGFIRLAPMRARGIRVLRREGEARPIAMRLAELCRRRGWDGLSDPIAWLDARLEAAGRERVA